MTVTEIYEIRRLKGMPGVSCGYNYGYSVPYVDVDGELEELYSKEEIRSIIRDNLHYYGRIMLEENPGDLIKLLCKCEEYEVPIADILNDTISPEAEDTWYSPMMMCISYVVGKFTEEHEDTMYPIDPSEVGVSNDIYYGGNNVEGISNEDAITILRKMVSMGADKNIENYYGETLLDISPREISVDDPGYDFMSRSGNGAFWEEVYNL